MATNEECVCCIEIPEVVEKINELGDPNLVCIISHPGFSLVCLASDFLLSISSRLWGQQNYRHPYPSKFLFLLQEQSITLRKVLLHSLDMYVYE